MLQNLLNSSNFRFFYNLVAKKGFEDSGVKVLTSLLLFCRYLYIVDKTFAKPLSLCNSQAFPSSPHDLTNFSGDDPEIINLQDVQIPRLLMSQVFYEDLFLHSIAIVLDSHAELLMNSKASSFSVKMQS